MAKRLIIAGLIIAALLGGLGYFQFVLKPRIIATAIKSAPNPPATVTTERARVDTWVTQRTSIGSTVAEQSIDVSTPVGGILSHISVTSGSDVKKGDALFKLDTSVEQADLASAKATLMQAQIAFDRASDLAKKSYGSQATLDQARAARDTATAAVHRVEALIDQKTISAAFSGRIGITTADLGQYVSPGAALARLQSLDPMWVDFPMAEQDYAMLKVGQKVEVKVDAWPGITFTGAILALDARVTQATRTLLVRASLPNPDRRLLPGMFANVMVLLGSPRQVVTVPRTAITYSLYGDSVYVVVPAKAPADESHGRETSALSTANAAPVPGKAELTVERRFVKLGEERGSRIEIVSGLKPGAEVVTTGQVKLRPNARVRISNKDRLQPPKKLPLE